VYSFLHLPVSTLSYLTLLFRFVGSIDDGIVDTSVRKIAAPRDNVTE